MPAQGGTAQWLTSHPGFKMFPRFSPDGKLVAFTGQYEGNTEVFVVPTDGGEHGGTPGVSIASAGTGSQGQ
jgi:tricorn protease